MKKLSKALELLEETKKELDNVKIHAVNTDMQQFNQSPNLKDDSLNMNTKTVVQSTPNSTGQSSQIESVSTNSKILDYSSADTQQVKCVTVGDGFVGEF